MDRRRGPEAEFGIGGGIVSKESELNLDKAEDLCRRGKPEQSLPFLEKAMEDEENIDAFVQMAFLMPTLKHSVALLEQAEKKGRENLQRRFGRGCFEENSPDSLVGRFWAVLETRPYMRVLQATTRLAFEGGDFRKSANAIIKSLRLCPGDNLGQRYWAGSVLLKANRAADALSFAQAWLPPQPLPNNQDVEQGGCAFRAPTRKALSKEHAERLVPWTHAQLVYTGALAAFTLWGNCELARQYLHIAAELNPHVLIRILGKVAQPQSLNDRPRTMNGPEDAHDYLWLTQDLWMKPRVWNWVNSDEEIKQRFLKVCSRESCDKREKEVAQFKRCAGCREAVYCGPECQKGDWKAHKPKCQQQQGLRAAIRAVAAGKPIKPGPDGKLPIAAAASADFSEAGISTVWHAGGPLDQDQS